MGNVNAPLGQWAKRPTTFRDKEECELCLLKTPKAPKSLEFWDRPPLGLLKTWS